MQGQCKKLVWEAILHLNCLFEKYWTTECSRLLSF